MSSSNDVEVSPFNGHVAGVHLSNNNKTTKGVDNAAFNPETNTIHLSLPSHLFANSSGIAFDIGGSRCKVAYIKKSAKSNEALDNNESAVTVEFVFFPRDQMLNAINYVKTHEVAPPATDTSGSDRRVIKASGTSLNMEYKEAIEREFQAKVVRVDEFSLSGKALQCLLRAYPKDDAILFHDVSPSVYKRIADVGAGLMNMMISLQQQQPAAQMEPDSTTSAADNHDVTNTDHEVKPAEDQPMALNEAGTAVSIAADDYPYMLVACGSGTGCTLVAAPNINQYVTGSQHGGLVLLGLAKLLFNVTDYSELMELADRGDEGNVTLMCRDMCNKLGPENKDFYDFMPPDTPMYPLGRLVGTSSKQENPRAEDVANALVKYVIAGIVREVFWTATTFNCKTVYVAGGLFEHRFARDVFNTYFMGQSILTAKPQMKCRILKAASYLPSLGALLGDTC